MPPKSQKKQLALESFVSSISGSPDVDETLGVERLMLLDIIREPLLPVHCVVAITLPDEGVPVYPLWQPARFSGGFPWRRPLPGAMVRCIPL